jgi:hypothetical protein
MQVDVVELEGGDVTVVLLEVVPLGARNSPAAVDNETQASDVARRVELAVIAPAAVFDVPSPVKFYTESCVATSLLEEDYLLEEPVGAQFAHKLAPTLIRPRFCTRSVQRHRQSEKKGGDVTVGDKIRLNYGKTNHTLGSSQGKRSWITFDRVKGQKMVDSSSWAQWVKKDGGFL